MSMARAGQSIIKLRIVIERPVIGVAHSLQTKDGAPLDPKSSDRGEPLSFDLAVRVGPDRKFSGDQVRREGAVRRFVYIRIGDLAGDPTSAWSRRMKIDIHDIDAGLLERAAEGAGIIETVVDGTGRDGTPACATLLPTARRLVDH
jgi:hypothetical protein